jgi:hypothetical protein
MPASSRSHPDGGSHKLHVQGNHSHGRGDGVYRSRHATDSIQSSSTSYAFDLLKPISPADRAAHGNRRSTSTQADPFPTNCPSESNYSCGSQLVQRSKSLFKRSSPANRDSYGPRPISWIPISWISISWISISWIPISWIPFSWISIS